MTPYLTFCLAFVEGLQSHIDAQREEVEARLAAVIADPALVLHPFLQGLDVALTPEGQAKAANFTAFAGDMARLAKAQLQDAAAKEALHLGMGDHHVHPTGAWLDAAFQLGDWMALQREVWEGSLEDDEWEALFEKDAASPYLEPTHASDAARIWVKRFLARSAQETADAGEDLEFAPFAEELQRAADDVDALHDEASDAPPVPKPLQQRNEALYAGRRSMHALVMVWNGLCLLCGVEREDLKEWLELVMLEPPSLEEAQVRGGVGRVGGGGGAVN